MRMAFERNPDYRFSPTPVEVAAFYLAPKLFRRINERHVFADLDICKFEPSDLPRLGLHKSQDAWYFFAPHSNKSSGSSRRGRSTALGFWKPTGKDRQILSGSKKMGRMQTLVYFKGHPPNVERSAWIMHVYSLDEEYEKRNDIQSSYAVCKIFEKLGPVSRNGEQRYGAPLESNDLLQLDCQSSALSCPEFDSEDGKVKVDPFPSSSLTNPLMTCGDSTSLESNVDHSMVFTKVGRGLRNGEQYGAPFESNDLLLLGCQISALSCPELNSEDGKVKVDPFQFPSSSLANLLMSCGDSASSESTMDWSMVFQKVDRGPRNGEQYDSLLESNAVLLDCQSSALSCLEFDSEDEKVEVDSYSSTSKQSTNPYTSCGDSTSKESAIDRRISSLTDEDISWLIEDLWANGSEDDHKEEASILEEILHTAEASLLGSEYFLLEDAGPPVN